MKGSLKDMMGSFGGGDESEGESPPASDKSPMSGGTSDQMKAFKRALDDGKWDLAYSVFEGLVAECQSAPGGNESYSDEE